MPLPNDPVILLSYINTKLRDKYSSLDELCRDMGVSCDDVNTKLGSIGYEYIREQNQFR